MEKEEVFEFPCRYPIKAMGRADGALAEEILKVIRRHAEGVGAEDITTRPSPRGNYVSVTVTITAHSRAQLEAIYGDLRAHELVLMTL
jgi:Uncharacterized conserved protein